jgi:hypothetical protein
MNEDEQNLHHLVPIYTVGNQEPVAWILPNGERFPAVADGDSAIAAMEHIRMSWSRDVRFRMRFTTETISIEPHIGFNDGYHGYVHEVILDDPMLITPPHRRGWAYCEPPLEGPEWEYRSYDVSSVEFADKKIDTAPKRTTRTDGRGCIKPRSAITDILEAECT